MDNVKAIRLFLQAAQIGSLSGAGREFGLSPASVSRQISSLEDDLGVRLLNRTSRRLSLTEAGQIYLQRAERWLQDLDEMREEVSELTVRPRGRLRVQSRISLGTQHVAPLIPDILAQYPDLEIDLWLTDTDLDLTEHGIDVAIRTGNQSDSSLIARRISSSPRVVCASPGYWAAHPRPETPKELADHNCLIYRIGAAPALWKFRGPEDASTEMEVAGNFQSNNAEALRIATLEGLGVALLPAWSIKDGLLGGGLERALGDYVATATDLDFGIYAVYLSKRYLSVKTRLFIDYLVSAFSQRDWSSIDPVG
ncbi:MAG: LysR family transcriptional regulator [Alphaproteobacteria bacterium]|nr:LysR family transcriptional regulator [Alphaproteobacteria bacterium]